MQYGHVEAWLSKMLLYGAAGSGKTCTNNMIAGNPPPENRHSTPAAVRPATVYRVSVEGKEWTKLTTQEERKSFLARMLFTFVPVRLFHSYTLISPTSISPTLGQKVAFH